MAAPSSIEPSRLYQILNNTGLQSKDNPLYQLLYYLIGQVLKLTNTTDVIVASGSATPTIVNNNTTIIGMDGQDGEDGLFTGGGGSSSSSGVTLAQVTAAVSLRL